MNAWLIVTSLQLEDEAFDVVVDKGGLDALMEPELGPKLGNQYLSEVCDGICSMLSMAYFHL